VLAQILFSLVYLTWTYLVAHRLVLSQWKTA
jgi:hypothetical protein